MEEKKQPLYCLLFQWDDDGNQDANIEYASYDKEKVIAKMKKRFDEELSTGRWGEYDESEREEDMEIEITDEYCDAQMLCDSYWLRFEISELNVD